jgi:hypothetical protein
LIDKGFIKATHFAQNPNKLQYAYLLTPQGIASKAALTTLFLERKIAQYEHLRGEIEVLKAQVARSKILDAALENDNDQAALGNFGDK